MAKDQHHTPLISVSGVRKSFGGKEALRDLTFQVQAGEIFGFLGPSGAGKTTTIKLLTRQLRKDAGDITLFGEEISGLKQEQFDGIGVLTDNSGLYERLSVYENLAIFADIKQVPKKRIDEMLAKVGMEGEGKKPAKALSRGMKQRLMLARAVLHKPRLLFLDEPTAALDPATSRRIHEMLLELNGEGTTIFLTTHNMEEADKLCGRVAFLDQGHIVACDTPEALKLAYARNEIVALMESGAVHRMEKTPEALCGLAEKARTDGLLTLHSQEPNLEEIFLQLTGRGLS